MGVHFGIRHNIETDIQTPGVSIADQQKKKEEEKKEPVNVQKAVKLDGLDKKVKEYIEGNSAESKISAKGIAGDKLFEGVPTYIESPAEKVISNENNASIILGRDRSGTRESGYGGAGETHAASIDLVAGRLGTEAVQVDESDSAIYVDPNFEKDAARLYISQKCNVDEYFKLVPGKVGNAKTKSGIGIKADGIRLISREGIKLVTSVDDKNSQGGERRTIYGVDIIADNDDSELQPMVKGENLQAALVRIVNHLDKLNGIVDAFLHIQIEYNNAIATHWHNSPFFAIPTTPSEILVPAGLKASMNMLQKVKRSLLSHKQNLGSFKLTYLNVFGKNYINSRHNNVN